MKIELAFDNPVHAVALAVFLKRVTFDDAYRRADGDTEAARKEMAYRILDGLSEVKKALAEAGISARKGRRKPREIRGIGITDTLSLAYAGHISAKGVGT